jgi:hypothetical protein
VGSLVGKGVGSSVGTVVGADVAVGLGVGIKITKASESETVTVCDVESNPVVYDTPRDAELETEFACNVMAG